MDIKWEDVVEVSYADKERTILQIVVVVYDKKPHHSNADILTEAATQAALKKSQMYLAPTTERDEIWKGKTVHIIEYHVPEGAVLTDNGMYHYKRFSTAIDKQTIEETPDEIIHHLLSHEDILPYDKEFILQVVRERNNPSQNPSKIISKEAPEVPTVDIDNYWRNEKEYLQNEDEDLPYFISGLLNAFKADNVTIQNTPRVSAYDILFCNILRSAKQVSSYKFMPIMRDMYEKGFISTPFSANVLTRSLTSPDIRPVLEELLSLTAAPFAGIDTEYAVDSSGFTGYSYSQWCKTKYPNKTFTRRHSAYTKAVKQEKKEAEEAARKAWLKVSIISGVRSHAVFGLDIAPSYGEGTGDPSRFENVVNQALKYFTVDTVVTADKAYSTKKIYNYAEEKGFRFICDFKKNATGRTDSNAMNKAYHFWKNSPELFHELYTKRNNVESVFSTIKNKVGERIYAHTDDARYNELYCKMIAYNLMVLIRLYYLCGIEIQFKEV